MTSEPANTPAKPFLGWAAYWPGGKMMERLVRDTRDEIVCELFPGLNAVEAFDKFRRDLEPLGYVVRRVVVQPAEHAKDIPAVNTR